MIEDNNTGGGRLEMIHITKKRLATSRDPSKNYENGQSKKSGRSEEPSAVVCAIDMGILSEP